MANRGYQANSTAALRVLSDYSILPMTNEGAPTDGTSGTGAGRAGKGCLLTDVTNGVLYINTGTKASPTWTIVGTQAAE